MYFIQRCVICRPSDSTVSEDAGIESRTVATSALAVRRSRHSAKSHAYSAKSYLPWLNPPSESHPPQSAKSHSLCICMLHTLRMLHRRTIMCVGRGLLNPPPPPFPGWFQYRSNQAKTTLLCSQCLMVEFREAWILQLFNWSLSFGLKKMSLCIMTPLKMVDLSASKPLSWYIP